MARRILALVTLVLSPVPALAQIDARMLRTPAVSATQIAFAYAGDIWLVPKEGGAAQRLSTPKGQESFPRFSPDGKEIAFTASYDGNPDVYVVPAAGGVPRRITHNPEIDRVLGFRPPEAFIAEMKKVRELLAKIDCAGRMEATAARTVPSGPTTSIPSRSYDAASRSSSSTSAAGRGASQLRRPATRP